jgi:hypothetical protein
VGSDGLTAAAIASCDSWVGANKTEVPGGDEKAAGEAAVAGRQQAGSQQASGGRAVGDMLPAASFGPGAARHAAGPHEMGVLAGDGAAAQAAAAAAAATAAAVSAVYGPKARRRPLMKRLLARGVAASARVVAHCFGRSGCASGGSSGAGGKHGEHLLVLYGC